MDDIRALKLRKHFSAIIHGGQDITPLNHTLFIEAVCASPEPVTTINGILASEKGISSIQKSLWFVLTPTFLNGPATDFIKYISSPDISNIGSGLFLQPLLLAMTEPPIFWTALINTFKSNQLSQDAQFCFAWLLLQLISFSGDRASIYMAMARDPVIIEPLLTSLTHEIRAVANKIKHVAATLDQGAFVNISVQRPGGRHDNDFVDFHDISILPTADELVSKEESFIRPSCMLEDPETLNNRISIHLDNQFRLLREDMIHEMKDELQIALGKKKGKHRGFNIDGLMVRDIYYETPQNRKCNWAITFECIKDPFNYIKPKDRMAHFKDRPSLFKHQSMACLLIDGDIVAFPTIHRDESLLSKIPPKIVLQFADKRVIDKTLVRLHDANQIRLLSIDTAVFAYEPILKALQEKKDIPFSQELLFWSEGNSTRPPESAPLKLIHALKSDPSQDLQVYLSTSKSIKLDKAQAVSFLTGLTQKVSLIQGPPGTGKSFIGALLAKALHKYTTQKILVVCFTNHALDQFLEDLMDIGIPDSCMVRLGGKSTTRTEHLALHRQTKNVKIGKFSFTSINMLQMESNGLASRMVDTFGEYKRFNPLKNLAMVLQHLQFDHPEYYAAFLVPESSDGMQIAGRGGRAITPDYLISQWTSGRGAGVFENIEKENQAIWNMHVDTRKAQFMRWREEMIKELVERLRVTLEKYNTCREDIERLYSEKDTMLLREKRIIGCTTTGAAKYREAIAAARTNVLLVEEAGEILESHILTALGPDTDQIILIGDHQQLRPKVNHYLLTVEKGDGYDLNRSLFERLVLKGYPHEKLLMQHRMRPEISALVRELTYKDLIDAPATQNRPDIRGVRDNIVFINHSVPEGDDLEIEDKRDLAAKSSKQNEHEALMILKMVRYLAQQGYGTDKMVVLTPYLGQLRMLRDTLKKENDPVLNDLDSYDLVKAGLLTPSAADVSKRPIRLSTIDNYQGEESDVVLISMTRSNPNYDIGFMSSRERLTVLLSRARNALIMIGNSETFIRSKKGGEVWKPLFELLRDNGHIYDGFPIRCERHPQRLALLKLPKEFDNECPDGGCLEPCSAVLNCKIHKCPSKCHQISDHSKMACEALMYTECPNNGHEQRWRCSKGPPAACRKCDDDNRRAERKKQDEFKHAEKLAELNAEIAKEAEKQRDARTAEERENAILQKEKDLEDARAIVSQPRKLGFLPSLNPMTSPPQSTDQESYPSTSPSTFQPSPSEIRADINYTVPSTPPVKVQVVVTNPSSSPLRSPTRDEWERRKRVEGDSNDAIDKIMEMTGLENVKAQVLKIKDKIAVSMRQGSDIASERFNVSMLGNPGTGKTTVARHYGKFLASIQVIPGNTFVETTGSRLAHEGVGGAKKQIEDILKEGGGTMFIDEAYQLAGQHNFQGSQVLDFLLAEMENRVGKIVFIFAGYNKEMEKFFEHNPGLPSRVPYRLQFEDYKDDELLDLLENSIHKAWNGRMKGEGGIRGLYGRIAVRRLGRGRDSPGFGNARALANLLAKIRERQADRITKERAVGWRPDDFILAKEDLIGPNPSKVMQESKAWKKLQTMIGLTSIKQAVKGFFNMTQINYDRELLEKKPNAVSLNRVFLGSPGTGKTTVAKLYGQILADLGLISNGEVVVKNPADFIGNALGQSESQTKAILATTLGKVLVIDEAYMLYGGSKAGGAGGADSYKTAVIDTIVAEVQSVPGEDRCVLLLGYKQQIEEMFQNVNPGLSRRFAIDNAFHFDDYSDSELAQALDLKLKDQDLTATDHAKQVALEVLSRARNRPNFGNIGAVENLLSEAKMRYQDRQGKLPVHQRSPDAPFEPTDFDPKYDRGKNAGANLAKLFSDVVGSEDIVKKLSGWQTMAENLKKRNRDPRLTVPTTFIFKGPPGTGKTTTARKMGQVYYDMGFLSSTEVIECSATDLIGQFVGQTAPKTQELFEKALGRVLFIDEAYRLSEGQFAKEAIDELVGILTQERYKGKLIVILAGYDEEMNDLLRVNPGLSSRFPTEIIFKNMTPVECLEILKRKLAQHDMQLAALDDSACPEYRRLLELVTQMSSLKSWGNARDVETLSKEMAEIVFSTPDQSTVKSSVFAVPPKEAITCVERMRAKMVERESTMPVLRNVTHKPPQMLPSLSPPILTNVTTTAKATTPAAIPEVPKKEEAQLAVSSYDGRDPGVSDEIWRQLQIAKKQQEQADIAAENKLREIQDEKEGLDKDMKMVQTAQAERLLKLAAAQDLAERAELMRQREEERLREHALRLAQAKREAEIAELERQRREEARIQSKLREMGVCSAGFRWIKQPSGYRCAGGSHFASNEQLGI
ncbi:P-loop containing nucleoside triphosphate hydrolase protein [Hysterangium stoloniferum]|nr:P-loop containing nucleoside triphosphate hydrolase protein [Hysterangium stoloniferum]